MQSKYGVQPGDFYNFDETGFAMGMIRATTVVISSERTARAKAIQPGNREWATAICCIAADGYVLPPCLCVLGRHHLATWYADNNIPEDWVVKPTDKGWTDNTTGLEWLMHLNGEDGLSD
ncbi:CENP-B protein [Dacryopinax primogenitus]|uniref:CENP-B protein n=1 Tax=Dacryopinax primogenitus (strain DJM 731) TaxID=1858805 RepID=M5G7I3_DACPD|nr:CENP-B protein [Dacryopinax primogenitus]EJU04684.1 CENP-B protein [Dacryopinax primogenitus]